MSEKLMTTRRYDILQRREKYRGCGTNLEELPKDKYGKPIWPKRGHKGSFKPSGTPMAARTKLQMLRYVGKQYEAGRLTKSDMVTKGTAILRGVASKSSVYGAHPTRKLVSKRKTK